MVGVVSHLVLDQEDSNFWLRSRKLLPQCQFLLVRGMNPKNLHIRHRMLKSPASLEDAQKLIVSVASLDLRMLLCLWLKELHSFVGVPQRRACSLIYRIHHHEKVVISARHGQSCEGKIVSRLGIALHVHARLMHSLFAVLLDEELIVVVVKLSNCLLSLSLLVSFDGLRLKRLRLHLKLNLSRVRNHSHQVAKVASGPC